MEKASVLKSVLPVPPGGRLRDVDLFGASPPGFFVGRFGYPNVRLGPLVPVVDSFSDAPHLLDAPEKWFGTPMERVVEFRSSLARSNFTTSVKLGRRVDDLPLGTRRLLETSQELAMAARPVDTEAHLTDLRVHVQFDDHALPVGPSGTADRIRIDENVPVRPAVERAVGDVDLNASGAVFEVLYQRGGLEVSEIQRVFSAGLLGRERNRRLVPTRWAVTAVDDVVSRGLVAKLKSHQQLGEYLCFEETYLDNHFTVLLAPGTWSFEMMEVWAPNSLWNQPVPGVGPPAPPKINADHEYEGGRKSYASNVTGAYYAARLAVAEYLERAKRCGWCVVFREVSSGYLIPLGVWVIRETLRKALVKPPARFDSLPAAFRWCTRGFAMPAKAWRRASKLLNRRRTRSLAEFLRPPS
ncbi:MAG: Nre family DNA repair protein [Promethearchaeota archaeon]